MNYSRLKFYDSIDDLKWHNWKWQIANKLSSISQLENITNLSSNEKKALESSKILNTAITPYYSIHLNNKELRKTIIPSKNEFYLSEDEFEDPLGEEEYRRTPYLIHTYPDKVLFLVNTFCSTYCRYCTRSRIVGKPQINYTDYNSTYEYIKKNKQIRDVLISGGDPLNMSDTALEDILSNIRKIKHVDIVRIGSKVPAVLPMRITNKLCLILKKYNVWMSLHFIHPNELTLETNEACLKMSNLGIPMVSQTVLLKSVNDSTNTLTNLFYKLLKINVKPYYLLQCDPIRGSSHFRTSVKKGIRLIRSLHGNISGLAIPQYVIDAPGGGGKVPLISESQLKREGKNIYFLNYKQKEYSYPDYI